MIELPEQVTVTMYKDKNGCLYQSMKSAMDADKVIDNFRLREEFFKNLNASNPFSLNYGGSRDFSNDLLDYVATEINDLMPFVHRYQKINAV